MESLTLSTSSTNPTVMQYDGVMFIRVFVQNFYIYINGNMLQFGMNDTSGWGIITTINFNKGDNIYINIGSASVYMFGRYYKLRDYSGRT